MTIMSIEQKAISLVDTLTELEGWSASRASRAKDSIINLLKEQDRDTRYACAEAVGGCGTDMSGECIWKDDAFSACINTRGGL